MTTAIKRFGIFKKEGADLTYRRGRHAIKMDQANHRQELEEERPSESAKKAFRHRPYEGISVQQYLDKLRRDVDGQAGLDRICGYERRNQRLTKEN